MKKLIFILLLISTFTKGQDTIKWLYQDTLVYWQVTENDTTYHYKVEKDTSILYYKVYEKNGGYSSFRIVDGKWVAAFRKEIVKAIFRDGICNGITATGARCSRKVDNSKSVYYCWQHKYQ